MNNSITIRPAQENDIEYWCELRCLLWPDSKPEHLQEIKDFFDKNSIDIAECFVALTQEDDIIGFIELNIRNFAEGSRNPQVPYIEGWFVNERYQNQGVGKALIKQAEEWAIELGFDELASDTELVNEKSTAIHKHLGFQETERVICFLKTLKEK
ncbi:MAG: GNAT family N-acetyltransferase [Kangiellaceae bacterium]|nr:GNAT family N-acetyltransferase [Kangiellaceae bacterium]MCW9017877.1 GNAT family N-acetyltransferase [Kangiellaceae bacterium]